VEQVEQAEQHAQVDQRTETDQREQTARPDHPSRRPSLRYNFVFFFATEDYLPAFFGREVCEHLQVRMYKTAFDGPAALERLFHCHWAYRVNRRIDLPFKSIWFKRMYRQDFANGLPTCFVYLSGNTIYHSGGWCEYVRRRDPRNRQVVLHLDLIEKKYTDYPYADLRDMVDLCVTCNPDEAERFGIHCFDVITYTPTLLCLVK